MRSVLVVRHGYLVYERYWRGDTATSGQGVASVTKSLTGTLVGIALGNHHLRNLDQTVGSCSAATCPQGPIPGWPGHRRPAADHDRRAGP